MRLQREVDRVHKRRDQSNHLEHDVIILQLVFGRILIRCFGLSSLCLVVVVVIARHIVQNEHDNDTGEVNDVQGQLTPHNLSSEATVQELDDDLDVRRVEQVVVPLLRQTSQEVEALRLRVVQYPVGSHSLHAHWERQEALVVLLLLHDFLEEVAVNVGARVWRRRDDVRIFLLAHLQRLLVDHLERVERTLLEVMHEALINEQVVEDVADLGDARIINVRHVLEYQVDHAMILGLDSNLQGYFILLVRVVQRLQKHGIGVFIISQDVQQLLVVKCHELVVRREDGFAIVNEVVALEVEQEVAADISIVKQILDDKREVAEAQVDEVPHDHPIVRLGLDAVAVAEVKLGHLKVFNAEVVALQLATLLAHVHIVFLSQVRLTVTILEENSVGVHVERLNLQVLVEVPHDDRVLSGGLLDAEAHNVLVTASAHLQYLRLLLVHRYIQIELGELLVDEVYLPRMALVPHEYEPLIHGDAAQVVNLVRRRVKVEEIAIGLVLFAGHIEKEGAVENGVFLLTIFHFFFSLVLFRGEVLHGLFLLLQLLQVFSGRLEPHQNITRIVQTGAHFEVAHVFHA